MKFLLEKGGDIEVILAFKGMETCDKAPELFEFIKGKELFKGDVGEVYSYISIKDDSKIFLGLGEEEKLDYATLRKAFFKLGKETQKQNISSIGFYVPQFGNRCYGKTNKAISEGLLQAQYDFNKFKSNKKPVVNLTSVYLDIVEGEYDKVLSVIKETETLVEGIFLARDLVNEPAITMYPEVLAKAAYDRLTPLGVEVTIFDKPQIEEMKMEAFLSVSRGSAKDPKFIVMKYNGNPDIKDKLALVGKGLTYDSGGYSLKPAASMVTMHSDMAGSAAVIGAMYSIAKNKLKKNVVAIVAACENLISGDAYKTGDIIGSMSGKTIEVENTDAEGRLTLADALWYATTVEKADKVIDIATLTGACVVALGSVNTGAVTNSDKLMESIKTAAKLAGEPVWELPHNEEYKELFKSHFADLKNTGGRAAGAITAGMFLQEFVNDTPWVHLDIAGTSFLSEDMGYLPKGATGVPVKTLFYLAKDM
ncbi:MAG: leucyl aminopeptidase [Gudongella sp.]|nr:leucyl aminopeptidase [Gudongella sp.]